MNLQEGSAIASFFLCPPRRMMGMEKEINVCYFQSGGPTAVINSSLFGVLKEGKKKGVRVYGSLNGIEGIINDNLIDLSSLDEDTIDLLPQTPGVFLGSSRNKMNDDPKVWCSILKTLQKHNISCVLPNGGNDSMDTCAKLSEKLSKDGIRVVGIPKTIDNDLDLTDHCPGFASAARHVINQVKLISIDAHSYTKGKVVLIEVMGREAGWLAASADLLAEPYHPDLIHLPESEFSEEKFLQEVEETYKRKGTCVAVLSEGIPVHHDVLAFYDSFGHVSQEGVALELGKLINKKLGIGVRTVILSTPVRANPYLVAKQDSLEAAELGAAALNCALEGKSGVMMAIHRLSDEPYRYEIIPVPAKDVANKNRLFPKEWILSSSSFSPAFHAYLRPLLSGSIDVKTDETGTFLSASIKQ